MKIFKLNKTQNQVTRTLISKIGHQIYQCEDVKEISLQVIFKDGSNIGFNRSEDEDDFDALIKEEE